MGITGTDQYGLSNQQLHLANEIYILGHSAFDLILIPEGVMFESFL